MQNKKFVTLFERFTQVHKNKDVGQIPKVVGDTKGWESEIWGESDYCDIELRKLKIAKINIHALINIIKFGKKIDVLNLYHIRHYNMIYAFLYKMVNRKGIVYIKGDFDLSAVNARGLFYSKYKINELLISKMMKYVDLVSSEQREILPLLGLKGVDCIYIPNSPSLELSHAIDGYSKKNKFDNDKKKKFLFIGRVGTYQKNIELLLNEINRLPPELNYELNVLGPIDETFQWKLNNGIIDYPRNVNFIGMVGDISVLAKYYCESDILVMTSRYEGFPLCGAEAAYGSCAFLINHNCGLNDVVTNSVNGYYYSQDNELKKKFELLCNLDDKEINLFKGRSRKNAVKMHWRVNIPILLDSLERIIDAK